MSTKVILVRHGETDWNAEGRIQGHLPVPLNERGLAQAEAVATQLAPLDFSALYSSDLVRARQTAEAIARCKGMSIRSDERLREWDLGILSGLTRSAAGKLRAEAYGIFLNHLVDEPIPEGESMRARYRRVISAVQDIASVHQGETVVVVSHGGPLGDCYRRAAGAPLESRVKIDLFNAGINVIRVTGKEWIVEDWGSVDHLDGVGTLANWEGRASR